jgi:hypothetical protein
VELYCKTNIQQTTVKFGSQLSRYAKTIPQRRVILYHLQNSCAILHSKTALHSCLTTDCPRQPSTTNSRPQYTATYLFTCRTELHYTSFNNRLSLAICHPQLTPINVLDSESTISVTVETIGNLSQLSNTTIKFSLLWKRQAGSTSQYYLDELRLQMVISLEG